MPFDAVKNPVKGQLKGQWSFFDMKKPLQTVDLQGFLCWCRRRDLNYRRPVKQGEMRCCGVLYFKPLVMPGEVG